MAASFKPIYCPALRMKAGELQAMQALDSVIAQHTLPRLIVPPRSERDPNQPQLFEVDYGPDVSAALARHWRGRDAMIDPTYLMDEYGRDDVATWLPRLFARARNAGGQPVPLAQFWDLQQLELAGFAAAIDHTRALKFAIVVPYSEISDQSCKAVICSALERLSLAPEDCAIIVDFGEADAAEPAIMAPIILASLEALQEMGLWQYSIFQGAHFPEDNPAPPGGQKLVPRGDWRAWKLAVGSDPLLARQLMFGDYGADCAKIEFGKSGGRAIPHLRYSTEDSCLVVRGPKSGPFKPIMRSVANTIVKSEFFAGRDFCAADRFIFDLSRGGAPGNATTWRQININHHLTTVINQVGSMLGTPIPVTVRKDDKEQATLALS